MKHKSIQIAKTDAMEAFSSLRLDLVQWEFCGIAGFLFPCDDRNVPLNRKTLLELVIAGSLAKYIKIVIS